ncbi:magnesium chelatase domain-containing protein [Clostridium thailandense]|uniref:magnesium chelatase domain-containing protein n=1 Tax=Clostridium thailandense TaxID=2794346 RepID=UPI003989A9B1
MGRKKLKWYPGALYHITTRGNHRNDIFRDDEDYLVYLIELEEVLEKYCAVLYCYCLMTNHVHLAIQTDKVAISQIMKRINQLYTIYFNNKYNLVGHLFQGRYYWEIIEDDKYVLEVGLGDTAVKEARERLEAAIIHEKFEFPKMKIVINLAPGDIKKSGAHFDLAMAIGLLLRSKQIIVDEIDSFGFIGELKDNHIIQNSKIIDFEDVHGQDSVIDFIVVAAAGGHNIILSGSPGCGKSMIAKRIPTILPSMTEEEALEVTKIHTYISS